MYSACSVLCGMHGGGDARLAIAQKFAAICGSERSGKKETLDDVRTIVREKFELAQFFHAFGYGVYA